MTDTAAPAPSFVRDEAREARWRSAHWNQFYGQDSDDTCYFLCALDSARAEATAAHAAREQGGGGSRLALDRRAAAVEAIDSTH